MGQQSSQCCRQREEAGQESTVIPLQRLPEACSFKVVTPFSEHEDENIPQYVFSDQIIGVTWL